MALAELGAQVLAESPLLPLLNEIRLTADYILRASHSVALSLGRGMASTMVAQRHLWLTLSDIPDRDRATYLDEPVMAAGLFGQSLEVIQAKFELRKKQAEALRCIIPRRDSRPKTSTQKPATQPPPVKRTVLPGSLGTQPPQPHNHGQPPPTSRLGARAPLRVFRKARCLGGRRRSPPNCGTVTAGTSGPGRHPAPRSRLQSICLRFCRTFRLWVFLCALRHRHRKLTITASCMKALSSWREPGLLCRGSPIGRVSFRKVVSTDASLVGWGALCDGAAVSGVWTLKQSRLHINCLELLAVLLALKQFCPVLQNQHVLIRTDNTTVVSYINRQGGTRSLPLLELSHTLLQWCNVHFLSIRATHVPGRLNLGPDLLSRGRPMVREWRLHPSVVDQIWTMFGRAAVDLFATGANTHCPLFFSITDQNAPLGVDALAHPWPNVLLYAFPPVEMILPVLERVRRQRLSLILMAPHWPAKCWYAEIISLLAAQPWQLPLHQDLLSQAGGGGIFHPHPELWRLHAYLLKGPAC
ncbi:uncharacterized protein LOC106525168 [Austrofundulus limnaeus]|uniref:Uncharacterized protein LOC106525168 n=1 Tax=Austrofundulus limnaeus TaxID=52670 RepID=A0A2I4C438_AUSLI|nr:PREDICTED: uncharacterized protein LOC106525168 [Austrofundulus limnaeus]